MKAVYITRHGTPEVLRCEEKPDLEPGPGELRLAVRAAGINFADIMQRMGLYPGRFHFPYVPGFEVAGTVEAIGEGVEHWKPGTRALAMLAAGGYASQVVVPAGRAVPLPAPMSFEEAAALPVNYVTAYHMMVRLGSLRKGERILIHTAAGGVGIAAIQLARGIGAEIFGTASSSKHAFLREQGVNHPIDYRTQDFAAEVSRLTQGSGVDMILDPLGGAATAKNYRLLAPMGRLMVFGFSRAATGEKRSVGALLEAARMPRFHPRKLMMENRAVYGVHLGRLNTPACQAALAEELAALFRLYAEGRIRPLVGKTFPLEQAAAAHRFIQRRENIGKVLLIP